jgi:AraC-like DNA-binding protein
MKKFYPFHMRQIPSPTIDLPLACRSVGHYKTFAGWHNPEKVRPFLQVYWGVAGKGQFRLEGEEHILHPGEVFIHYTNALRDLTALTNWEFRWMTLDGKMPDEVVRAFGFGAEPMKAGPCPGELFERLSHEIEDASPQGQRAASATAYEILSLAFSRMHDAEKDTRKLHKCIALIRRHYGDPDVNVTWLARQVGIHRTNLSKLFREKMKLSVIEYLTSYRVTMAIKLLQGTDRPVREIAHETGFSHTTYFTHVIRRHTGHSPREIRGQW